MINLKMTGTRKQSQTSQKKQDLKMKKKWKKNQKTKDKFDSH